MSNRWPGGIIRKTPITPAGPLQCGSASGVWSLADAAYWAKQGLWPVAGNSGFAIFALGAINACGTLSTTRNRYTFSSDAVSSATAATGASARGSAAGNSTVGIFALGCVSFNRSTTRNKYTYSGCVVSAGGAATQATAEGAATGNSTTGIFALGRNNCSGVSGVIATRDRYTYSGDVVSSAASASRASVDGAATGNSTVGIFALGGANFCGTICFSTCRNKYTYASNTSTTATSSSLPTRNGSATGNSTVGIFAIGNRGSVTNSREKYTYSGDVNSSATAASVASSEGSAAGNTTTGIFALGLSNTNTALTTRDKYIYSSCVVSSGGAATQTSYSGSATSGGTPGVNM
jgi:hypothetical protein